MIRPQSRAHDRGEINILLIPLVLLILVFIGAAGFGFWAYNGRQDYKTRSDLKVNAAIKVAKAEQDQINKKQFGELEKLPLKTYAGPEQLGSVHVSYPKTWSGYVMDSSSSQAVDGYFQPNVVPDISDQSSAFALRVKVVAQSYDSVVQSLSGGVTAKTVTATPFAFPKVANVVGIRYDGAVTQGKKTTGSMVIVPLRDKTLEIWTESPIYTADFNTNILPNVSFSP